MKTRRNLYAIVITVCGLVMLRCAQENILVNSGAGSETTNGFVAVVKTAGGLPVPHALVRVRPASYLPDTGYGSQILNRSTLVDTFTDEQGRLAITNIDTGKYCIEIQDGAAGAAMLRSSARKDSVVDCGTIVASPVGGVRGYINRATMPESVAVYVRVYGMQRILRADPVSGAFALSGLPHGDYTLYLDASSPSYKPKASNITVSSDSVKELGKVSLFPFNTWTHSMGVGFNTTAGGANVAQDVFGFPVLIRFNTENFIFSQAQTSGNDIRFAKSDSTPLSFEIEQWDPVTGHAEVWVKMDTVFGSSDKQSIIMFWGNAAASPLSDGSAVFDTANGYQGVWHFSDAAGDSVRDATGNRYDGVSTDAISRPSITSGIMGNCRTFDGKGNYIVMPNTASGKLNFAENASYTVSAWVLVDTLDVFSHLIVSKGYEQYYVRITSWNSISPQWEFVEFHETTKWETSTFPAAVKQWTLITGVRQGARQLLYCNGVLVDSTIAVWSNTASRNTSNNLSMGKFLQPINVPIPNEGYDFFKGSIDEVRILSAAQSPDWVRLCYMNQRSDDKLVHIK